MTRAFQLAVAIAAGAWLFPASARAACALPAGSYAGAGAGVSFSNGAGVTGVPSWESMTNYQSASLTITRFPTTTGPGTFKLSRNLSYTPKSFQISANSLESVSGQIAAVFGYDATTCSGEFVMIGESVVRPIACNVTALGPTVMNCAPGAPRTAPFRMKLRFTSSQAGNRVTLAPMSVFSNEVLAFAFELWRQ